MKGSRRRRSERQRKGERNRDGEIVVVQGGWERKEKPHMFDNCEKWMEMEMIPALTAQTDWALWGERKKKEMWVRGVALLTTEKIGQHTHSSL